MRFPIGRGVTCRVSKQSKCFERIKLSSSLGKYVNNLNFLLACDKDVRVLKPQQIRENGKQ